MPAEPTDFTDYKYVLRDNRPNAHLTHMRDQAVYVQLHNIITTVAEKDISRPKWQLIEHTDTFECTKFRNA